MRNRDESKTGLKPYVRSFVIGGLYGVFVHIMFFVWHSIAPGSDFVMAYTLISCGFIVMLLYICGITQKFDQAGGFGAIVPLIGLVSGVATPMNELRKNGVPFGQAFLLAAKPPVKMLVTGYIGTVAVSVIVCLFKQTPDFPIAAADPVSVSPLTGLLISFIFMGAVGVIGQCLLIALKPDVSGVMRILLVAYFLGNFISWFGLGQYLGAIAIGGYHVSILGAGEFSFTSIYLGMKLGIWSAMTARLIAFIIIVASQFLWAAIAAAVRTCAHR